MIAAAIAIVFAIFAVLMYRRVLPAILALPLMAVVMALVAGVPFAALGTIVVSGASDLSQVYVAVIFGALLGRVTMDTGIARAMVNLAAEYGGERPFALAMVLCAIVAVLFTSLSGLGAIIMVGSIVLPIMMTVGVPRTVAATLFLMSFALGFIFNIANWTFYTKYFNVAQEQMVRYAVVLAVIDAVVLVAYAIVAFRREREYATWAVRAENEPAPHVPAVALLTPVLPIVLYYALKMPATPAFMISALFGVLVTRPREAVQTLVAAAIRGVEDVAPAVLLFMGIGMLLVATQQPQFAAALQPLAGGWIANPALYVLVFGVASPLALYRGPLNPFGVGIAIFTVLLAAQRRSAGRSRRRDYGGRASAKRLRSDQYGERVGRQLHRRADRHHHEAYAAVPSRGCDRSDAGGGLRGAAALWRAGFPLVDAGRARRCDERRILRAGRLERPHRDRRRRHAVRTRGGGRGRARLRQQRARGCFSRATMRTKATARTSRTLRTSTLPFRSLR